MLVEDNATDVFVIKEVLRRCALDLNLRVAGNGQDALLYLQDLDRNETSPSLVLLDLNIPKVAGIEVLRQLRGASRCKTTPVIVVTSSDAEADRRAARELGTDAYFLKPRDLAAYMELATVIQRVLDSREKVHKT